MKIQIKRVSKSALSIVIVIMMIMSMMLVGVVSASAAANATIYYKDSNSTSVKIWAWNGGTNYTGGNWDNRPTMKSLGNGVFSYELDTQAVNVIFDGGTQTSDLTLPTNPNWTTTPMMYDDDINDWVQYSGGTPSTAAYYLGGRIIQDGTSDTWCNALNKNYPFVATDTEGVYKYESKQTPAGWSKTVNNLPQYFFVHQGSTNKSWYGSQPDSDGDSAVLSASNQTISLLEYPASTSTEVTRLTYINSTDTNGNVIIYLDTRDGMKLYYATDAVTTVDGACTIEDKTVANGSLSFASSDATLTPGTANAGDTVTVTATPYANYFTLSSLTASYVNTSGVDTDITVTNNKFTVPSDISADEKTITVAATFTLNKAAYVASQDNGLWLDVAPDKSDTTATLIKWNNYQGSNHNTTTNPYTFYVPKNVDLSNANIYSSYDSDIKLNSIVIPANGTANVSLTAGTTYTAGGNSTYTVKVMQGSTDSMFLHTTDSNGEYNLPSVIYDSRIEAINASENQYNKDSIKATDGACVTMTSDGTQSSMMGLAQVKGRGNSSWGASTVLFGKYAFNMKFDSTQSLLGLPKSKSYCLLANNADESMLRNAFIYDLAKSVGLYDSPEFRFVDIYDNGEYLGQYLVTEKVDVASKNKLIKGNSIDDLNEDAGAVFDESNPLYGTNIKYANPISGNPIEITDSTDATYLLEFEIPERVADEASYFKSNKGQNVVLKNPEFASLQQVQYIQAKFNAMEALVYADTIDLDALSQVMDIESFAKMYLVQELTANIDAAATSYYITYNCVEGKFKASPVWDYDWTSGQYANKNKYAYPNNADGQTGFLDPTNPTAWFAKNKAMGDGTTADKFSLQSKLANDAGFQSVIKKAWNGSESDGFYNKLQAYYATNGQLDTWASANAASFDMNETRWGFIASDPATKWGSNNTGATNADAVSYLKTDWTKTRAEWMDTQIQNYANYTAMVTPTLTASATEVNQGASVTLTATTTESNITFTFYDGATELGSNTTGTFTVDNIAVGTHSYTVKATYTGNSADAGKTSTAVTVTASEVTTPILTGVSLSVSSNNVASGATITLTATPATLNGDVNCTYSFYRATTDTTTGGTLLNLAPQTSATLTTTAPATDGTYYYYVVAVNSMDDTNKVTSATQAVTVTVVSGEQDVRIYFKSSSATVYVPTLTLDGTSYTMTRNKATDPDSTYFGSTYSGSLKFFWYYADVKVDTAVSHKITFTTPANRVNASMDYSFGLASDFNYYFAVNNLMSDTTLVDLTGKAEYIRNYHLSATHMVYVDTSDVNIGFTYINGTEYAMGSIHDDGILTPQNSALASMSSLLNVPSALNPTALIKSAEQPVMFTIESATLSQKVSAELNNVSELQYQLLDVNLDGIVDVKDSTLMQKALVNA